MFSEPPERILAPLGVFKTFFIVFFFLPCPLAVSSCPQLGGSIISQQRNPSSPHPFESTSNPSTTKTPFSVYRWFPRTLSRGIYGRPASRGFFKNKNKNKNKRLLVSELDGQRSMIVLCSIHPFAVETLLLHIDRRQYSCFLGGTSGEEAISACFFLSTMSRIALPPFFVPQNLHVFSSANGSARHALPSTRFVYPQLLQLFPKTRFPFTSTTTATTTPAPRVTIRETPISPLLEFPSVGETCC